VANNGELSQLPKGDVFVVGSGDCGQLGLGQDVLEKERPALLSVLQALDIVSVKAGGLHNAVLTSQGKVYSWGCNDQCALGRQGEETEPGLVSGGGLDAETVVSLACGDSVTAALTAQGRVYTWGTFRDNSGIFGLAPGVKTGALPRLIPQLKHIVQIEAGANHLIAMSREGVFCSFVYLSQNAKPMATNRQNIHVGSRRARSIGP
jgi:regulator of chromosome condensation